MKCPHCNNKLEIPDNATIDMETYLTPCCGKILQVKPYVVFVAQLADPDVTEDDRGNSST